MTAIVQAYNESWEPEPFEANSEMVSRALKITHFLPF